MSSVALMRSVTAQQALHHPKIGDQVFAAGCCNTTSDASLAVADEAAEKMGRESHDKAPSFTLQS